MNDVAVKKTEPLRRGTEQEQKLNSAMARIQEARLHIKGNPHCTLGCHGTGTIGIRTLPMTDGGWDVYLEPCKCSKPSDYALLSDQLKQLGERVNQLAALTFNGNEVLFRHSFFGGFKVAYQRTGAFIKRIVSKIHPAKPQSAIPIQTNDVVQPIGGGQNPSDIQL